MHIVFNYINVFAVSLFYLKLLIVIVFAGKINKSINHVRNSRFNFKPSHAEYNSEHWNERENEGKGLWQAIIDFQNSRQRCRTQDRAHGGTRRCYLL